MSTPTARDRLVAGATRLFYGRGVAASGVDRIATESGVSKPTLYTHFHAKHELVAAVLEAQHRQRRGSLQAHLAARAALSPGERLLSVLDWIEGHQQGEWARGCPFVNASVELVAAEDRPARSVVHGHKRWFRRVLRELAQEAGARDPEALASQLHLLIEGANARMLAESDWDAIADARSAATALLDLAAVPAGRDPDTPVDPARATSIDRAR